MNEQLRMYTIDEASKMLGIGRTTIYELIERGILKSVLIKTNPRTARGARRITHSQLKAYISKLEIQSKS